LPFGREDVVDERLRALRIRCVLERGDRVIDVGRNRDGNGITLSFGATDDVTSVLYTTPASPSPSAIFVTTAFTSSSFETTFFSTAPGKSPDIRACC